MIMITIAGIRNERWRRELGRGQAVSPLYARLYVTRGVHHHPRGAEALRYLLTCPPQIDPGINPWGDMPWNDDRLPARDRTYLMASAVWRYHMTPKDDLGKAKIVLVLLQRGARGHDEVRAVLPRLPVGLVAAVGDSAFPAIQEGCVHVVAHGTKAAVVACLEVIEDAGLAAGHLDAVG